MRLVRDENGQRICAWWDGTYYNALAAANSTGFWTLTFFRMTTPGENCKCNFPSDIVTADAFHHIVVTYGGSNNYWIYSDTVRANNVGFNLATLFNSDNYFYIGQRGSDERYWDGNIADLKVYNRELSEAEIAVMYRNGPEREEFDPLVDSIRPRRTPIVGVPVFAGQRFKLGDFKIEETNS